MPRLPGKAAGHRPSRLPPVTVPALRSRPLARGAQASRRGCRGLNTGRSPSAGPSGWISTLSASTPCFGDAGPDPPSLQAIVSCAVDEERRA